jgi:hypothetical protein
MGHNPAECPACDGVQHFFALDGCNKLYSWDREDKRDHGDVPYIHSSQNQQGIIFMADE